ncbi:MAG TPA: hypothetical protein VEF72_26700 [Mycobacterium sp.]|nr:hypothetical protein [Mycobacterium sp.]
MSAQEYQPAAKVGPQRLDSRGHNPGRHVQDPGSGVDRTGFGREFVKIGQPGVASAATPKAPSAHIAHTLMDKFAGDALMAVFVAPVSLGIGVGGRPLLASGGRNGTVRIWDLHGGDAVGKPLIGHIERSGLTQAPPDAALTDSGRSWGESFSSMPTRRALSCCATSQLNDANVSDAGMPA